MIARAVAVAALPVLIASTPAASADRAPASPRSPAPCDLYKAAGTPCVTAHSTTRLLLSTYSGPLYQVRRQSDGRVLDIGLARSRATILPFAAADAQDRFCDRTLCVITIIYDQSGKGNDLYQAPPGPLYPGPAKGAFDAQPIADMAPISIGGGRKAYGAFVMPGMGFRNNNARDLPINDEAAGIHVVVDGSHYSNGCCFNYGNASTNGLAVGTGTMESVYFGTSSGWGSGSGTGPWIMSDMEAGLFSGYNAGVNEANPTITSRFVTGVFGGGGSNFWALRSGDAQKGMLTTSYEGVRPGSRENSAYFPMHKKGAIQMGNGGDNGNGSSGTFYEGVMTAGQPTASVTDAVQANIVAAAYDVPLFTQSRLRSFQPASSAEVTATFTNTTGVIASGVTLALTVPPAWTSLSVTPATFAQVLPGASVQTRFRISSPAVATSGGFASARVTWLAGSKARADTSLQRVRSAPAVKINEVRFASGGNATNQFVEIYNASSRSVDLSGWQLTNTRTFFAPVPLATLPAGTWLAPRQYYLLGLAPSGLTAPTAAGARVINVRSIAGLTAGQPLSIDGEARQVTGIGTAATTPTTIFIPVSTGPRLNIPVGSTNLPVADASGFAIGQKIGIDVGGNHEIATVTAVGKAGTQTTLASTVKPGMITIKVASVASLSIGDMLTVGTGQRMERVRVAAIGTPGEAGTGVRLSAPLRFANMIGVDVAGPGTGISFAPATKFAHTSGDAVQALGSGITLDRPLQRPHRYGAPVGDRSLPNVGYQGLPPQQWFGGELSIRGGAISLTDPSGKVLVDAIVYGSQQSNSSASGPVTAPELATLEGVQHQGGCIAVIPGAGSGPSAPATASATSAPGAPDRSIGRFPDGADSDSLCDDFFVQPATTVPQGASAGERTIRVAGVANFVPAESITIGAGDEQEKAVIASVGSSGATVVRVGSDQGGTTLQVASATGFEPGQGIGVGTGVDREEALVRAVQGGRAGARLIVATPLGRAHAAGTQVAGGGITLTAALARDHEAGAPITAELPTPGAANRYAVPLHR